MTARVSEVDVARPRTAKKKTTAQKRSAMEAERKALFEKGSSFAPVSRTDIVGIDNVLDQIDIVIHWLRNYKEYSNYGARLEPGLLFEGDPGTGKTLVSRYIATQSNARFISVRDFPHEGSFLDDRDIASLFKHARATQKRLKAPVVIFWDEFEGSASDRGSQHADKDEIATVSQLTSELDGIAGKNEGILLIGCTNYGWKIDEALVRPGRMGIRIEFNAPDHQGKMILLDHYLSKYVTEGRIDTDSLAHFFKEDITASGIEEAVMEAWRLAVYRSFTEQQFNKRDVPVSMTQNDLIETFLGRMIGPRPTFSILSEDTRLRVAVHESAHAIAALVFGVPLKLITVRPGRGTLGSIYTAKTDHHLSTVVETEGLLRMASAPVIAERMSGLGSGMGVATDTKNATELAISLVDSQAQGERTGYFSARGVEEPRNYSMSPSISSDMINMMDADVKAKLDSALSDNEKVFDRLGRERLIKIAKAVVEQETIIGYEFKEIVEDILGDNVFSLHPDYVEELDKVTTIP